MMFVCLMAWHGKILLDLGVSGITDPHLQIQSTLRNSTYQGSRVSFIFVTAGTFTYLWLSADVLKIPIVQE